MIDLYEMAQKDDEAHRKAIGVNDSGVKDYDYYWSARRIGIELRKERRSQNHEH